MTHSFRTLLLLTALCSTALGGASARAGAWEARTPQGLVMSIEQDAFRTRQGYVLARRYPDGNVDSQFGDNGSVIFNLGPDNEGPAVLRVDALGRAWVAGASAGSGDHLVAVVLRFTPLGLPDAGYAEGGRSATQPGGRGARARDVLPLADGSALVVGIVQEAGGQERSGWWRLLPDGRLDPRFGLGGLWLDTGAGSTEIVALEQLANGGVTLQLRRGNQPDALLEQWHLAPGQSMPRPLLAAADTQAKALPAGAHTANTNAGRETPGAVPALSPPGPTATAPMSETREPAVPWLVSGAACALVLIALLWRSRR